MRKDVCASCGLLYWEKTKEHKYLSANESFCNLFYNLSYKEVNAIIGKTDVELITKFRETGEHTFSEFCFSTDKYMETQKKKCRFFEFGYKKGKPFLLDIVKTPVFNANNKFNGTTGFALNLSSRETDAFDLLNIFLQKGFAIRLSAKKDWASYLIKDRRQNFNRSFP